jgi:alpha-glucosidase
MLELYRSALRLRRSHPALGDGSLTWEAAGRPGVIDFRRDPGFRCLANLADEPVPVPAGASVLLASAPLVRGQLPVDGAVWLVS